MTQVASAKEGLVEIFGNGKKSIDAADWQESSKIAGLCAKPPSPLPKPRPPPLFQHSLGCMLCILQVPS